MKGIVLAGGSGTRLHPVTRVVSKQLLPVYDKPMVYYPLSVLMLGGIRDVLVISTPDDLPLFERLLGDGSGVGISLSYAVQPEPNGLPEAFTIGRNFLDGSAACLVLGDNIFHGAGLSTLLQREVGDLQDGCTLFGFVVADPERYGVAEVDEKGAVISIEEKPFVPRSSLAVTGLYMYDGSVSDRAAALTPSGRGELEITDLNMTYVDEGRARLVTLGRGMAWLDTGTHDSLLDAAHFVQVLEHRQGEQIACLEEIAFRQGWISIEQVEMAASRMGRSSYADALRRLVQQSGETGDR